jgi:hypothetical protein
MSYYIKTAHCSDYDSISAENTFFTVPLDSTEIKLYFAFCGLITLALLAKSLSISNEAGNFCENFS